jgi:hypothetical protein
MRNYSAAENYRNITLLRAVMNNKIYPKPLFYPPVIALKYTAPPRIKA